GLSGTYLSFYDVTDPALPVPIGSNVQISLQSIGTRMEATRQRVVVKLADIPNPGFAVVDLRLALVRATLLPFGGGRRTPTGAIVRDTNISLIDSDASGGLGVDFLGVDANGDGDFGDPGDLLPDIKTETELVLGRVVTPGVNSGFTVSPDGRRLFVAEGFPIDANQQVDQEPNTGLTGKFYGVRGLDSFGNFVADTSGGIAIVDISQLDPVPLIDSAPRDGLDDRVLSRINTPLDDTGTSSTRVLLAEQLAYLERVRAIDPQTSQPAETTRAVVSDLVFVSNAAEGAVTIVNVDDPRTPQRIAVIRMPPAGPSPGAGLLQPVDLQRQGSRLLVDVNQGLVEIDLDRAVFVDETIPAAP
ncbi:MAG: hypothetical protein L0206_21460, partial [Actinobacteria bacterium]|nr:hypothetical protein [Actinomycetota bacterium]